MWTTILSFFKGKVFSEAGSLLIPLLILLAVFLIWNSDSILTKFGFETTANLKSEVTRLKGEVDKLKEANEKLSSDLKKAEEKGNITGTAGQEFCAAQAETKSTVDSVTSDRKKEAERIKKTMYDNVDTILPIDTHALLKQTISSPVLKEQLTTTIEEPRRPAVSSKGNMSKVDALSLNNIRAIHTAYAELFKES